MAFALKYRIKYKTVTGVVKQIRLSKDGFDGAVTDFDAGENPFRRREDEGENLLDKQLIGTLATIQFIAPTVIDLAEFIEDRRVIKCELYNETTEEIEFSGWVEPYNGTQPYSKPAHVITLSVGCGLAHLSKIRYVPTGGAGFKTYKDIVYECLLLTGHALKRRVGVFTRDAAMTTLLDPMGGVLVETNRFLGDDGKYMYASVVLENILNYFTACCVQIKNEWYIQSAADLAKGYGSTFNYGTNGAYVNLTDSTPTYELNDTGARTLEGGSWGMISPIKKHVANVDFGRRANLIVNGDLRTTFLDGTFSGFGYGAMATGVSRVDSGNAEYPNALKLTGVSPNPFQIQTNFWGQSKIVAEEPDEYISTPFANFNPYSTQKLIIEGQYKTNDIQGIFFAVRVIKEDASETKYLQLDGTFSNEWRFVEFQVAEVGTSRAGSIGEKGKFRIEIDTKALNWPLYNNRSAGAAADFVPFDRANLRIYKGVAESPAGANPYWILYGLKAFVESDADNSKATYLLQTSSTLEEEEGEDVNLITGDYVTGYEGATVLDSDNDIPTGKWARPGNPSESKRIVSLMLLDRLSLTHLPLRRIEAGLLDRFAIEFNTLLTFGDTDGTYKIVSRSWDDRLQQVYDFRAVELKYTEPNSPYTKISFGVGKSGSTGGRIAAEGEYDETPDEVVPVENNIQSGREGVEINEEDLAIASYGTATHVGSFVVTESGRIFEAEDVLITPAWDDVTDKPDTVEGFGITDAHTQGGNSYGEPFQVGSNDSQPVQVLVNGVVVGQITTGGQLQVGTPVNYLGASAKIRATGNVFAEGGALITSTGTNTVAELRPSGLTTISGAGGFTFRNNSVGEEILFRTSLAVAGDTTGVKIESNGRLRTTKQIVSDLATGTAPLLISSTTLVSNLNADLLDGQHGAFYQNAGNLNAGIVPSARLSGTYTISVSGNAATATKWATARTISATGDATGSASVDGSANAAIALTLANSGVTAATYGSASLIPVITVDAKGRITGVTTAAPTVAWSAVTSKPTTLSGFGITDAHKQGGNAYGAAFVVGSTDAQNVEVRTNGVTRISVSSSGNIGIGVNATSADTLQIWNPTTTTNEYGTNQFFTQQRIGREATFASKSRILFDNFGEFFRFEIGNAKRAHTDARPAIVTTGFGDTAPYNTYGKLLLIARAENSNNGTVEILTGSDRKRTAIFDQSGNIIAFNYLRSSVTSATAVTTGLRLAGLDASGNIRASYLDSDFPRKAENAAITGLWTFNTALPTSTQTPTTGAQLVTKSYVDGLASIKRGPNVRTISKTSITLSGTQTINGVALVAGDRVLVAGNTVANGPYIVASGAWTRDTEADTDTEIRGAYHFVEEGTFAGERWINTNPSTITIGTTPITYALDQGAETDPTVPAWVKGILESDIDRWDTAVLTTGSYSNPSWLTGLAFSKVTGVPNLATIEALGVSGSNGLLRRNVDNTWMLDRSAYLTTTAASAAYQPLNARLTAYSAATGTGIVVRTNATTHETQLRTIEGVAGQVVVTWGDGVSGNPLIGLATSGATAGTYNNLTVDGFGRITALREFTYELDIEPILPTVVKADTRKPKFDFPTIEASQGVFFSVTYALATYKTSYHDMSNVFLKIAFAGPDWLSVSYDTTAKTVTFQGTPPTSDADTDVTIITEDNNGNTGIDTVSVDVEGEETSLPACERGPELFGSSPVYNVSTTGCTFIFDGQNVFQIRWKTLINGQIFDTGLVSPTSSTVNVTFSKAHSPGATYTFSIEGASCSSTPSTFNVTMPGGVVSPSTFLELWNEAGTATRLATISSGSNYGLPSAWDTRVNTLNLLYDTCTMRVFKNGGTLASHTQNYTGLTPTAGATIRHLFGSGNSSTVSGSTGVDLGPGQYEVRVTYSLSGEQVRAESFFFGLTNNQVVTPEGRLMIMNATAGGFKPDTSDGTDEAWRGRALMFKNASYQGQSFRGIDGVQVTVKWHEYEPTEGSYQESKLRSCIQWHIDNGLKVAVVVHYTMQVSDNRIPNSECATLSGGGLAVDREGYKLPAMHGATARSKTAAFNTQLAGVLDDYGSNIVYVSFDYGNTGEFFLPGVGQANYTIVDDIGGYAPSELARWATYWTGATTGNAPKPTLGNVTNSWSELMTREGIGAIYRIWFGFLIYSMSDFHKSLQAPFQNAGLKVAGFFADAGSQQRHWYVSSSAPSLIFDSCDYIYPSEGDWDGIGQKLMCTDYISTTFPGKGAAIEFDVQDLHPTGPFGYGFEASSSRLIEYGSSFFKRDGKILHFALAFAYGENGNRNTIADLYEGLYHLRTNYFDQTGESLPPPVSTVSVNLSNTYNGSIGHMRNEPWTGAGGGLNRRVGVRDVRDQDFFVSLPGD